TMAMVAAVTSAATMAATTAVTRPVLKFMLGSPRAELVGFWHFESQDVVGLEPVGRAVDKSGLGALGLLLGEPDLPFIEIGFGRCKLGLRHELLLGARRLHGVGFAGIGRCELAIAHG